MFGVINLNQFTNVFVVLCAGLFMSATQAASHGSWQTSLGVGVVYAPRYEGSMYNRLRLAPILDISQKNGGGFIGVRGIGYDFSEIESVHYGVRIVLGASRSPSEDARLNGMDFIDYYPEAGVFLNTRLGPLSLSSSVARGQYGTHAELGGAIGLPLGKNDRLRIGRTLNWGDTLYNQTYFGVTATQAIASANVLVAYNATEGLKSSVTSAAWIHNFNKNWSSTTSLSHKRLEGSAQFSPITQRTSSNSLSLMLGYRF